MYSPPNEYGKDALRGQTDGPSELQKIDESLTKDVKFIIYRWWIILTGIVRAAQIGVTLLYELGHLDIISLIITGALGFFLLYVIWIAYQAFTLRDTKKQEFVLTVLRIYVIVLAASIIYSDIFVTLSITSLIGDLVAGLLMIAIFYYLADFVYKVFKRRDELLGKA
jgi:hypothetical protein